MGFQGDEKGKLEEMGQNYGILKYLAFVPQNMFSLNQESNYENHFYKGIFLIKLLIL